MDVRRTSVCSVGLPALSGRSRWRRGSGGSPAEAPFSWGPAAGATCSTRASAYGPQGLAPRVPGARAAMSRLSVRALRVLTPASALASLVANAIALCSNSWLHSTELMPNPFYNGSGDREQLAKNTVSGLWKMCFNERESLRRPSSPIAFSLRPNRLPRNTLLDDHEKVRTKWQVSRLF